MPSDAGSDKLITVSLNPILYRAVLNNCSPIKSNKAALSLVFRLAALRTNVGNKITKTGIKVGDSPNRTVLKVKKPLRLFVLIKNTHPPPQYWYCSPYVIKKKNKTR